MSAHPRVFEPSRIGLVRPSLRMQELLRASDERQRKYHALSLQQEVGTYDRGFYTASAIAERTVRKALEDLEYGPVFPNEEEEA